MTKSPTVGICDGARLCLHVGGLHLQRDTPHKESHSDMDKNSLSFIQLSIIIIFLFIFKFKLSEFDLTYYPYHFSIRIWIEILPPISQMAIYRHERYQLKQFSIDHSLTQGHPLPLNLQFSVIIIYIQGVHPCPWILKCITRDLSLVNSHRSPLLVPDSSRCSPYRICSSQLIQIRASSTTSTYAQSCLVMGP